MSDGLLNLDQTIRREADRILDDKGVRAVHQQYGTMYITGGPYEATAIGNALPQAMGCGEIANLGQLRQIVRQSFELTEYEPKAPEAYDAQSPRFEALVDG